LPGQASSYYLMLLL